MISVGIIVLFLSVYLLFAAAKRVEYNKGPFSMYWEARPLLARSLSLFLLAIGTVLLAYSIGIANALLALLVVWPTIASLVILCAPLLKRVKRHKTYSRGIILLLSSIEFVISPFS